MCNQYTKFNGIFYILFHTNLKMDEPHLKCSIALWWLLATILDRSKVEAIGAIIRNRILFKCHKRCSAEDYRIKSKRSLKIQ